MKYLLALLNLMIFMVICMMVFIRSGAGEEMIKGVVVDIVKEEMKKQLPSLSNVSEKYNHEDFILNIDPKTLR